MFTPPIRRVHHQMRQSGARWAGSLLEDLDKAIHRCDYVLLSIILNNVALLLFKSRMVAQAGMLCRHHYSIFVRDRHPDYAQLAVQPWINEGRLMIRSKRYAEARLRVDHGTSPVSMLIGSVKIKLNTESISVCRAVAVIDGSQLELCEYGPRAADVYLTNLLSDKGPILLIMELKLQLGLASGDIEFCRSALSQIGEYNLYLPMTLTYNAAISILTDDRVEFARNVLILVSLLGSWAANNDDFASLLHALVWLRTISSTMFDEAISRKTFGYIVRVAGEFGDQELISLLRDKPYDPAPPGSDARAMLEQLIEACLTVLDQWAQGAKPASCRSSCG